MAKYDEFINLTETSPAVSLLFDDLAAVRTLKAETIIEPLPNRPGRVGAYPRFSARS